MMCVVNDLCEREMLNQSHVTAEMHNLHVTSHILSDEDTAKVIKVLEGNV